LEFLIDTFRARRVKAVSSRLPAIEHLPPSIICSPSVIDHAKRNIEKKLLPGFNAAFASKFYELNPSYELEIMLQNLELTQGILPQIEPVSLYFGVHYLLYSMSKEEFQSYFPEYFDLITKFHCTGGIGPLAQPTTTYLDVDTSAFANIVCHKLGMQPVIPSSDFEKYWDEQTGSYRNYEGVPFYSVGCLMHVLEAILIDPKATFTLKQSVWKRTIKSLLKFPWTDNIHMSSIFFYHAMITVLLSYMNDFPDESTEIPKQIIETLLKYEIPNKGFSAINVNHGSLEETALTLLTLNVSIKYSKFLPISVVNRVSSAAIQARKFINLNWNISTSKYEELYIAKMPLVPVFVTKSIIFASLFATLITKNSVSDS